MFLNRLANVAVRRNVRHSSALASVRQRLDEELDNIRNAGTWKAERVITSKQSARVNVQGNDRKILNFCANNYLGLSSHPAVIEASQKALSNYGAGLSSVRFICGTQDLHKELEEKIARFHKREDAILYISCFDANAGIFEALLTADDAVISDELNHASIIDGIRLCKAKRYRYKHRNMADLESNLYDAAGKGCRTSMIVTDGVFSMDGNVTPLRDICTLAENYNAIVLVDECHATGFFGRTGRGTEEYWGLEPAGTSTDGPGGGVDIINSTLGKALGGAAGGYTTGPKQLIDLLRQRSRPYLFSNTLPPSVVAGAIKVFDLITESSDLIDKLKANTKLFRERMTEAGFNVGGDREHPICPIMLGDARLASTFADEMLNQYGIYVIGFSYPVVPRDRARIRVQLSAGHSTEDVNEACDAFLQVGRQLNVIS